MDDQLQVIIHILEIIGYNDDKITYAHDIITLSKQKAISSLIETLPLSQQTQFSQKNISREEFNRLAEGLKDSFTTDQLTNQFRISFEEVFKRFVQKITQHATEQQRNELEEYFESLETQKATK